MKHEVYVNLEIDGDIQPVIPPNDDNKGGVIEGVYVKVNGVRLFIEPVEDGCVLKIQKQPKAEPNETIEVMKLEIYNL